MEVLVACEESGTVRDAFIAKGHKAMSCDLGPTRRPGPHHQGDVLELLDRRVFDLMIAHPPCTYIAVSGYWRSKIDPARMVLTKEGIDFFQKIANHPNAKKKVIENPVCVMSTIWRQPDQIIQPYMFGHDASKKTCLWLEGVEPLVIPDKQLWFPPRMVKQPNGKMLPRWSNQTDSGQNRLPPSADRAQIRSVTYQRIADAFAEAWG